MLKRTWYLPSEKDYISIIVKATVYIMSAKCIHTYLYTYVCTHTCTHACTHPSIHPSIHLSICPSFHFNNGVGVMLYIIYKEGMFSDWVGLWSAYREGFSAMVLGPGSGYLEVFSMMVLGTCARYLERFSAMVLSPICILRRVFNDGVGVMLCIREGFSVMVLGSRSIRGVQRWCWDRSAYLAGFSMMVLGSCSA